MFKWKIRNVAALIGAATFFLVISGLAPVSADDSCANAGRTHDAVPGAGGDLDPEDEAKRAADERRKKMAEEDARRLAEKKEHEKTFAAVHLKGPVIEAAILGEDAEALEKLFNWELFAKYTSDLTAAELEAHKKSKDAPLLFEGDWERNKHSTRRPSIFT
jgi:hypothetical protein